MILSVSASQVAVSSSFMYPAKVASPDSTIGAAKSANTPPAATAAPQSTAPRRHGSDRAMPGIASATTSGTDSSAVASLSVVKCVTTMITASPAPGTRTPGSRMPETISSSRPQPTDSASSTRGKSTQQAMSVIAGLSHRGTEAARRPDGRPAGSADLLHRPGRGEAPGPLSRGIVDLYLHVRAREGHVNALWPVAAPDRNPAARGRPGLVAPPVPLALEDGIRLALGIRAHREEIRTRVAEAGAR